MDLGYFAADTLGVTLYQVKDTLKANEVHEMRFGPWRIELQMDVDSDLLNGRELGFWITFGKKLRMYVIIRERENWLFVLDTEALKECGAKTGFAGLTTKERVLEFKPAIRGLFRWVGAEWEQMQYDGGAGLKGAV